MNDSRNHHFTPRWYLRRFAHPESKKNKDEIQVYDFSEKKVARISARGVGAQNDFNRLEIEGAKPTWLETQWTNNHESPAKVVIERIDSTGVLPTGEDRDTLIRFLSLLFSRNPRVRRMNLEMKLMLLRESAKTAILSNEEWSAFVEQCKLLQIDLGTLKREELADAFAKNAKFTLAQSSLATFEIEQRLATGIFEKYKTREWLLVESAPGEEFWTSDYPVIEIEPSANITDIYGTFFPLTPTRGLIGHPLSGYPPLKLNRANMGFLNALQAQSAEHFVVMHDPKRVTLYHDDTCPQHWMNLIDGTRHQGRLVTDFLLRPRGAPVLDLWEDPRLNTSDG